MKTEFSIESQPTANEQLELLKSKTFKTLEPDAISDLSFESDTSPG